MPIFLALGGLALLAALLHAGSTSSPMTPEVYGASIASGGSGPLGTTVAANAVDVTTPATMSAAPAQSASVPTQSSVTVSPGLAQDASGAYYTVAPTAADQAQNAAFSASMVDAHAAQAAYFDNYVSDIHARIANGSLVPGTADYQAQVDYLQGNGRAL